MGASKRELAGWLAEVFTENEETIREMMRESLLASKEKRIQCPHCHRGHSIQVPDWSARSRFIEVASNLAYGKAPIGKKEVTTDELLDENPSDLSQLERKLILQAAAKVVAGGGATLPEPSGQPLIPDGTPSQGD